MKLRKLFVLALFVLAGCVSENLEVLSEDPQITKINSVRTKSVDDQPYYWHNDEKVFITATENSYVILRDTGLMDVDSDSQVIRLAETDEVSAKSEILVLTDPEEGDSMYGVKLGDTELELLQDEAVVYSAPYYILPNGAELGLSELFLVKLKSESDYHLLESFANEHNVSIVTNMSRPLWYKLSCTVNSTGNALEMANMAYESGLFANSEAIFVNAIKFNAESYNDPYFGRQWYLDSSNSYSINLDNIHEITTGNSDVLVAVIDGGFQLDHPDIDLLPGWDATHQTYGARLYSYDNSGYTYHGTGVSGIIGANVDNGIGIVGIAPDVSILPISIHMHASAYRDMHDAVVDAINYAVEQDADVISNSWSSSGYSPYIRAAIEEALFTGRDGKGAVVVFSSGNDGSQESSYPHSDIPGIISVGNTRIDGYRNVRSNYGPDLDIVAPGTNIFTLCAGSAYMEASGTSFSCPQVSAVAALMLSVNPNLKQDVVGSILNMTATKIDTYNFVTRPYGDNALWNEEVGYGLLNCYDAVNLAYYYNEDKYLELIEFDHSGNKVELSLTAKDNIAIIWDQNKADISFINASPSSPVDTTITHTYSSFAFRSIKVVETTVPGEVVPTSSSAITKFELLAGNNTSNIDIKQINTVLEYVRIIGGSGFPSQAVTVCGLPALEELYLVNLKNAMISVSNCPVLRVFGTSRSIWMPSSSGGLPVYPLDAGTVSPYVVGGQINTNVWPYVPEPVVSPLSLRLSDCPSVTTLSLENVGFDSFSFSGLNNLQYVYLSSRKGHILGTSPNISLVTTRGYNLSSAISTLPSRHFSLPGKVVLREVNNADTEFIPVSIDSTYRNAIKDYCKDNWWNLECEFDGD